MAVPTYVDVELYGKWVDAHDTIRDADRRVIREGIRRLRRWPLFSIVMLSAPNLDVSAWQASIASVQDQLYPHWELWLPELSVAVEPTADKRLRITPLSKMPVSNHSGTFNAALAAAEGAFVLPLLPDVTLTESALYELAAEIEADAEVNLLYTDEDHLTATGDRCRPRFKTGWDPDLALGRDAIGLLVVYRTALLKRLGGMRNQPDPALSLFEMSLRFAFATPAVHICHIPAVLCHRRSHSDTSLDWDVECAREIVRKHLAEDGVNASVIPSPLAPGWNWIVRDLPHPAPLVSVIIPTRDRADLLEGVADTVLSRTDYPSLELLIVDNDSQEPAAVELLRRLSQDPRVRVLPYPYSFNFSALNNLAAREARGEVLVLLNNDIESFRSDWLREMVSHAVRPDVGAVGAKLLYPDGRVQHGGMVLGPGAWPVHQLRFADRSDAGPGGELALTRTVSTVTGACLALRRSVFFEVGGLNEELRVVFNDIDLCLRIGDHGYRIVWTPFAELLHLESATRGDDSESLEKRKRAENEAKYFSRFWKSLLIADPFHNPNVIYGWDFAVLSEPPRRKHPWLR